MVHLDITETSKSFAVVGGYIAIFGLVSFFLKEKLFMSEALLAFVAGIAFGPIAANVFSPIDWAGGNQEDLSAITHQISRVIIAVQVLFTGIALPKAYLWRERLSLFTLLIPIMTSAWFIVGLLVWGLIPGLTFLESLVISSCVTPTDPVLANSICKGRFAEKHVPLSVRNIILAESGANDGLGFPFLFMPLYLILKNTPDHPVHTLAGAVGEWFYNIIFYQVFLAIVIGALIGTIARKVLRYAHNHSLIDHESFLSYGVALTFFTLGVVGLLGSDDILACFIVGNAFTWDDHYRVETEDHAFQDVIDQLLNTAIFMYIGAIMPWHEFGNYWGITPWRLVVLGILVILLRRPPWVLLLSRWIPALKSWREAAFAGYFGPIGVGAVFYVQVALEVLPHDRERLRAVILPVSYFMVMTSIVVHGITIPVGKGFERTLTITRSSGTNANLVSRLPPAVPYGSGELPTRNPPDVKGDGKKSARSARSSLDGQELSEGIVTTDDPTVHFDVPLSPHDRSRPPSRVPSFAPGMGMQWGDRPPSGFNTPTQSGRSSPVAGRDATSPISPKNDQPIPILAKNPAPQRRAVGEGSCAPTAAAPVSQV